MNDIRSKLFKINEWLNKISVGPSITLTDYNKISELLVSSIQELSPGFITTKLEAYLNYNHPNDPDSLNHYDKAIKFIEELDQELKKNIEAYTYCPGFEDPDVHSLFIKVNENNRTTFYIIPYDKPFKVLREL